MPLGKCLMGCRPTACALAAAPARNASISWESGFQNSNDLERPGRGGRLHARVGRGRRNSLQEVCLWFYTAAKNMYDSVNNILERWELQLSNAGDHQAPMGGE